MLKLIEYIGRLPKPVFVFFNLILLILIGLADYFSGAEMSFSIFYLVPVALATLFVNTLTGTLFAMACTCVWMALDVSTSTYSSQLVIYWNTLARLGIFLVMIHVLTTLKKESLFARRDFLTGIPNRRYIIDVGNKELIRLKRYKRPLTIAYLDIDNFKDVNDNFSHHVGDVALRLIADTMANTIRITDTAARIGGDEFVILLPETDSEQARFLIERVSQEVRETTQGRHWELTLSIGVVTYYCTPASIIDAIKKADELMYDAKKTGKNQIKYLIICDDQNMSNISDADRVMQLAGKIICTL